MVAGTHNLNDDRHLRRPVRGNRHNASPGTVFSDVDFADYNKYTLLLHVNLSRTEGWRAFQGLVKMAPRHYDDRWDFCRGCTGGEGEPKLLCGTCNTSLSRLVCRNTSRGHFRKRSSRPPDERIEPCDIRHVCRHCGSGNEKITTCHIGRDSINTV